MRRNQSKSFKPLCETLEDRCLLASSVIQSGTSIIIKGDGKRDVVTITDNGTNGNGAVIVQINKQTLTSSGPVTAIAFGLKGGNDRVSYKLGSNLQSGVSRSVGGTLAGGNDVFSAALGGSLASGSSIAIAVSGGGGRDNLSVAATSVDIAAGAQAVFALNGDGGNDTLAVDYVGRLDGRLVSLPNGGGGRNTIRNNIVPIQGSTGSMQTTGGTTLLSGPVTNNTTNPPLINIPPINFPPINIPPVNTPTLIDLSGLNLSNLGLNVLPGLSGILNNLNVEALNLSGLGLDQLEFGNLLDLTNLDLSNLGIPLDQLGLGFVDLEQLAQGLLSFNILDPSNLNLGNLLSGILDLDQLTQGQIDLGIIELDLSGLLGGILNGGLLGNLLGGILNPGQTIVDLRVLDLAELQVNLGANIGLGIFDLSDLANGNLNLGVIDLSTSGLGHLGLGIIGNVI